MICLKLLGNMQICANSIQNDNLRKDNRANSIQIAAANLCKLSVLPSVLSVVLFICIYRIIFFFFILNIKATITKLPTTLPTKLLYNTTKTVPGGAIDHDYPLVFNMDLKNYH